MKKRLLTLICIILLFPSTAHALDWKNVRFTNLPDYVFMIPNSYYTIFYGMPEDSPILQDLGMTYEYAELYLKTYAADVLLYPDNMSCSISIGRFVDTDGLNYNDIPSSDFLEYADRLCKLLSESHETSNALVKYTYLPKYSGSYGNDHTQYVLYSTLVTTSGKEAIMIQAITVVDGYQTILNFTTEENEYVEENLNTFFDILDNLIFL